jgi:prolyl 4-hydroxylase
MELVHKSSLLVITSVQCTTCNSSIFTELIIWQDEVVARIEERIAAWTFLPSGTLILSIHYMLHFWPFSIVNNSIFQFCPCTENGESTQILHYKNGEKYEPHYDYFHDKNNQALGGHRIATVLMYLSDVEKGGETIFPNAEVICPHFLQLS